MVISTAPGTVIGVVGAYFDALKSGYSPSQARGGHGELLGVVLVAGGGVGGAGKGAEVEDAPKEGPAVGYVGDEDGRAGFANIPKRPDGAEGLREGVVFVEGSTEDLWRSIGGMERNGRWKVLTTKTPRPKRQQRTAFLIFFSLACGRNVRTWKTHFRGGSCDVIRRGRGIHNIMRSEEMLKQALVMR